MKILGVILPRAGSDGLRNRHLRPLLGRPVLPYTCDRSVAMLARTSCDSVRTFCPVGKWHPAWMAKLLEGDRVEALHAGSIHRRQDLAPLFLHDGAAVAVSRASMLCGEVSPNDPHAF